MTSHETTIYAKAPTRISFAGGGTDVGYYAERYGGKVCNATISLQQHIEISPLKGNQPTILRIPNEANPELFKAILKRQKITEPLTITSHFDGIIGAGLGSSAAAAVALIAALAQYHFESPLPEEVANTAWEIETNDLGWHGGKQDQYASAHGGFNVFDFSSESTKVTPLEKTALEKIRPWISIWYTGGVRNSRSVQKGLSHPSQQQVENLHRLKASVDEFIDLLSTNTLEKIGMFLDKNWEIKVSSNPNLLTSRLGFLYRKAKEHGALGGKIMGAGGGGYLMIFADPDSRKKVYKALEQYGCQNIPFEIAWQGVTVNRKD